MYKITLVAKIEEIRDMIEKEDMITLIEAFEAWELLNQMVHSRYPSRFVVLYFST